MISMIMMSLPRCATKLVISIVFCSLLSLFFSYTYASDQSLPLHFVNPNGSLQGYKLEEQSHRLNQLRTEDYGKPEDFSSIVSLSFKENNIPIAIESYPFVFKPIKSSSLNFSLNNTYFLKSPDGKLMNPESFSVLPGSKEKLFTLRDFNEFWIDYGPVDEMKMCVPKLEFDFLMQSDRNNLQKKRSQIKTAYSQLSPLLVESKTIDYIDFSQDNLKEKDFSYLLSRMFRTAPDQIWRYTQINEKAIMQRRIDVPLNDITELKFILAPGLQATGINLRVSSKNLFFSREIIEFRDLENFTLPDGRTIVKINMLDALSKLYQKEFSKKDYAKKDFYLLEMNVFIPVDDGVLKKNNPVRGLELLENPLESNDHESGPIILKSYYQSISYNHKRLAVYLNRLNEQQRKINDVKNIKLWLYPPTGSNSCGISIRGIQATSVHYKRLPVFASLVDKWSQQFGEDFNQLLRKNDQVNSPGINAYLPFSIFKHSTLFHQQPFFLEAITSKFVSTSNKSNSSLNENRSSLYKVFTEDGHEIIHDKLHLTSSGGATLKFDGKIPEITLEDDQLIVKGNSKSIAISWPLSTITNENTYFLIRIDEGVKNVDSVNLALELADGALLIMSAIPNQPLKLSSSNIDIRKAKLLIKLKSGPFQLKLRDLVFFSPSVKSINQAFLDHIPTSYSVSPLPELLVNKDNSLQAQPGRILGKVKNGERVSFTSSFKPSLKFVQGIKIKYKLPSIFTNKYTCGLDLNFKWTNGNFTRQLCFIKNNMAIFIPISDLINPVDFTHNFGTLKSIDWKFNYPFNTSVALNEKFDFQFSVVGWAPLSAEDHLSYFPLFNKGKFEIFSDTEYVRKISMNDYKSKIVLPLEPDSTSFFFNGNNFIQAVKNSLFLIDDLKLNPIKPIHDDKWLELYSPPIPLWENFWVNKFFFITVIFGLLFAFHFALLRLETKFRNYLPMLSEIIYAKKSSLYFFISLCFGLLIIGFILFSSMPYKLATYLTTILFASLIIGLFYEIASLMRIYKAERNKN